MMAPLRVQRSWNAEQDLQAIWAYIAQFSAAAADRQLRRFDDKIRTLAAHPELGERQPRLGDTMRRTHCGKYAIFYEVDADTIRVHRVIHTARRWEDLV
jgi:toxin ParE1/3/4